MKYNNIAVIIPAYNEGKIISQVILDLKKYFINIICVNDGSTDDTSIVAQKAGAKVINHLFNLGQGGAIETGVKYALNNQSLDYFITFDADGQHDVEDAKKMVDEIINNNLDIILGSRFLDSNNNIPKIKKLILKTAIIFTKLTTGLRLTDTHNGLKIFNRNYAQKINFKNYDMTHASEMLTVIKSNKFRYKEIPIKIKYTEYSRRKGQPMINAINIIFDLIFKG